MIHIIGAGGVGSWLAPLIARRSDDKVTVWDGDRLEEKNLNRQLFGRQHIGMNKAEALAKLYPNIVPVHRYFSPVDITTNMYATVIMCVVDNNAARMAVLEYCDMHNTRAIFGANETYSSEAYVYYPRWKGTPKDPRVRYPELLVDDGEDPIKAGTGCTGEAAIRRNPQLVGANFMAAALIANLYELHINYLTPENGIEPNELTAIQDSSTFAHVASVSTVQSLTQPPTP